MTGKFLPKDKRALSYNQAVEANPLETNALPTSPRSPFRRKISFRFVVRWLAITVISLWLMAALTLVAARWIDPPTTAVHAQRRLQAWMHSTPY